MQLVCTTASPSGSHQSRTPRRSDSMRLQDRDCSPRIWTLFSDKHSCAESPKLLPLVFNIHITYNSAIIYDHSSFEPRGDRPGGSACFREPLFIASLFTFTIPENGKCKTNQEDSFLFKYYLNVFWVLNIYTTLKGIEVNVVLTVLVFNLHLYILFENIIQVYANSQDVLRTF